MMVYISRGVRVAITNGGPGLILPNRAAAPTVIGYT
jgi:hypothetical protein